MLKLWSRGYGSDFTKCRPTFGGTGVA